MSLEKRVLSLLADGKPRTSAEIIEAIGLPYRQVRHAIVAVLQSACVKSRPVIYTITPIGVLTAAHVEAKCRSLEEKKVVHAALRNRHRATRIAKAAEYVEKRAAMEEERVERKAAAEQTKADRIAERRAIKLAGIEQKAALIAAQTRARIANRMVERDPKEIAALAEESIRSVRFTPNSVFAMGAR